MTPPQDKPAPRGKPSHGTTGGGNDFSGYTNPMSHAHVSPARIDMGVDYFFNVGDRLDSWCNGHVFFASEDTGWPSKGTGTRGSYIGIEVGDGPLKGFRWYLAENVDVHVQQGDSVQAGQQIATYGLHGTDGNGTEWGWAIDEGETMAQHFHQQNPSGDPGAFESAAGKDFSDLMQKLGAPPGVPQAGGVHGDLSQMPFHSNGGTIVPGQGGGGGAAGGSGDSESIAKAAAISTYLQFPELMVSEESIALKGDRSLMNDQQLLPFVEQICQASLRNFQSMPNGNFFAFFPDYFGGLNHRTPYWEIHDIEIISGKIDLSDDALVTHEYVVGDTINFDGQIDVPEMVASAGVVTVFNAFMADFLNGVSDPTLLQDNVPQKDGGTGMSKKDQKAAKQDRAAYNREIAALPTLAKKENAIAFLKKYGARPVLDEAPAVRTPFFEKFLAYQKFCLAWSRQFLTTFEFTFMPELFPGGLVAFPEHGIQCYIDEVSHECDYEGGFVTRANLSAPAAIRDSNGIARGPRKYVHEGMIRGHLFVNAAKDNGGKK